MSYIKKNIDTSLSDFTEYRDRLFYNTYEYKLTCSSLGLRFSRRYQTLDQYYTFNEQHPWSSEQYIKKYTDNQSILKNIEAIKLCNANSKIRNEGDSFSIFSNDLEMLHYYRDQLGVYVDSAVITRAVPELEVGVLYFVEEPKFKYRTYFKSISRWSDNGEIHERLIGFVQQYSNHVKCNYRLRRFLSKERSWGYTSLYNCSMDYNDLRLQNLLAMTMNSVIDRHFELRQRPTHT